MPLVLRHLHLHLHLHLPNQRYPTLVCKSVPLRKRNAIERAAVNQHRGHNTIGGKRAKRNAYQRHQNAGSLVSDSRVWRDK
jgi:hypothetical protein